MEAGECEAVGAALVMSGTDTCATRTEGTYGAGTGEGAEGEC